jgi:DNA-directed RNA polymerase
METMFNNNWEFCNLPPRNLDRISMPRVGDAEDCKTPEEIEARKQLIAERAEMWSEWHKSDQKRLQMAVRLSLAKELHTLGFFYHSYTMDFRGRAYSVCSMLSPQAGDFDRGLLKFATPVQQTEEGMYWQKVALANTMDGAEGWNGEASDKSPFDERVAWVDANHDQLLYVADNPLETASLWADNETKKKNPSFQRLASIIDYAEAVREGTTSYPVQLDGACNGSQHWSAIRRDPVIAELTNVMPVEKPQDLYQFVADIATTEMHHRAEDQDNSWCQKFVDYWGTLKRKVVKRATMCDAYGITPHGIRKYAREEGHLSWVPKDQLAAAVNELAFLTIKGLEGAMVESNKGKDYVRYISDLFTDEGKHMTWEVPGGMRIVNKYVEFVPRTSRSRLYGEKYVLRVTFGEPTKDPDATAARGAIAPNFIHSFDAAHMRLAILRMNEAGVNNFSMIHDSYGCPAPQIPAMRQIIKETFLEVHQDNQLEKLTAYAEQCLGADVEPSPPAGTLDINGVLGAEYLFG